MAGHAAPCSVGEETEAERGEDLSRPQGVISEAGT